MQANLTEFQNSQAYKALGPLHVRIRRYERLLEQAWHGPIELPEELRDRNSGNFQKLTSQPRRCDVAARLVATNSRLAGNWEWGSVKPAELQRLSRTASPSAALRCCISRMQCCGQYGKASAGRSPAR